MPEPVTPPLDAAIRAVLMREVRVRLAPLHLAPAREAEIVQELSQHLEDRWRELRAGGVAPGEATRLALTEFQEDNLLARAWRHSARPTRRQASHLAHRASMCSPISGRTSGTPYGSRRSSRFSAAVILTLALGISATTALFSVAYGVLWKPLPFHESDRLVSLLHRTPGPDYAFRNHGPATYFTARLHQQTFECPASAGIGSECPASAGPARSPFGDGHRQIAMAFSRRA